MLADLTPLEAHVLVWLIPCSSVVLIVLITSIWHRCHVDDALSHERKKRQMEIDAIQDEKDKAALAVANEAQSKQSHERAMKDKEIEQAEDAARHVQELEELRLKQSRAYEDAMRDISTKYALYCPGCGKVMTLQHASRLPAEAQNQLGYMPPPEEAEENPKPLKRRRG